MCRDVVQTHVDLLGIEIANWLDDQPPDEKERLLTGGDFTAKQIAELCLLPSGFLGFLASSGDAKSIKLMSAISEFLDDGS